MSRSPRHGREEAPLSRTSYDHTLPFASEHERPTSPELNASALSATGSYRPTPPLMNRSSRLSPTSIRSLATDEQDGQTFAQDSPVVQTTLLTSGATGKSFDPTVATEYAPRRAPSKAVESGETGRRSKGRREMVLHSTMIVDTMKSSLALPLTPSLSEEATSSASTAVQIQWSRETSIDSHGEDVAHSSSTSLTTASPPIKGIPYAYMRESKVDTVQNAGGQAWDEDMKSVSDLGSTSSPAKSSDSGNDEGTSTDRGPVQSSSSHSIHDSAFYDDLMTNTRPKRRISKSIKQIEAEESQLLTPRRRRRRVSQLDSSPLSSPPTSPARSTNAKETDVNVEDSDESDFTEDGDAMVKEPAYAPRAHESVVEANVVGQSLLPRTTSSKTVAPSSRRRGRPTGVTDGSLSAKRVSKAARLPSKSEILASAGSTRQVVRTPKHKRAIAPAASLASDVKEENKGEKPAWKRKVFLTSGLYSDDHKVVETVKAPSRREFLSQQKEKSRQGTVRTRLASRRSSAFPLPTDYGYWVLTERRDFHLPFPIAQEIGEIRSKLASKRKPPPYKHISQNQYVSRPKLPGEISICQCPPDGTCDELCMNRQTQTLCHPKWCPCGDRCTNVLFRKRKAVKTEVQWYGARGFGLKTLEAIPKDSFIDEYRGEVISYNEMVRRVRDHYKDTGNYYFLMYDAPAGEMLDGGLKGNITRYANHSCDPNCKIQKWLLCGTDEQCAGEFQVALYAARDIAAGEELTYDYGWSAFSPKSMRVDGAEGVDDGEACHCGAPNCSGVMGRKAATTSAAGIKQGASSSAGKRLTKVKRTRRKVQKPTSSKSQLLAALKSRGLKRLRDDIARDETEYADRFSKDSARPSMEATTEPGGQRVEKRHSEPVESPSPKRKRLIVKGPALKHSVSETMDSLSVLSSEERELLTPGESRKTLLDVLSQEQVDVGPGLPSKLIDSDHVEILEGKRKRKPLVPFASLVPEMEKAGKLARGKTMKSKSFVVGAVKTTKRAGYQNALRHAVKSDLIAGDEEQSWMSVDSSLASTSFGAAESRVGLEGPEVYKATSTFSFDISQYPPGTKFYNRQGQLFDFAAVSTSKRRGKKPRPYTLEELKLADERHRRNLQRLNDLRKVK